MNIKLYVLPSLSFQDWKFPLGALILVAAKSSRLICGNHCDPFSFNTGTLLPTFHLEAADLGAMRQAINDYQAQLNWLRLVYTLPSRFSSWGGNHISEG